MPDRSHLPPLPEAFTPWEFDALLARLEAAGLIKRTNTFGSPMVQLTKYGRATLEVARSQRP